MRLRDIPVGTFTGESVDNCFFVNYQHLYRVELKDVFEWIKKEAEKNGLRVELRSDKILIIKKGK